MIVEKIDFIYPSIYKSNPANPPPISLGNGKLASIPGRYVIQCDPPKQTIKQDDDFFCNESQEITASIQYTAELEHLFGFLTEKNTISNGISDGLNHIIVKVYAAGEASFDGVLVVAGKKFVPESGMISFKISDLLRIYKLRGGEQAYSPSGVIGEALTYLDVTGAEFAFFINTIYKKFGSLNAWNDSPIVIDGTLTKMKIDRFYDSDVNPHDRLAQCNIDATGGSGHYAYTADPKRTPRLALMYCYVDGGKGHCVLFIIQHPWDIFGYDYAHGTTEKEALDYILNLYSLQYKGVISFNPVEFNGVKYRLQEKLSAPYAVWLKGAGGSWQASNLFLKSTATNDQVVKLMMFICGIKVNMYKNRLRISPALLNSVAGAIQLELDQIADVEFETVEPYDPVSSSVFDILDATDSVKQSIKSAVEFEYNKWLPTITKELSMMMMQTTTVVAAPGIIILLPNIPGYPVMPEPARRYYIYESTPDAEDPDWYKVKAYNVNF